MNRYEAHITKDWRNAGIANITIARLDESGYGDAGVFLVDPFCLGVKDAFLYEDFSPGEFEDFIERSYAGEPPERIHPAWAKKLIEGAIAYAEKLGFMPHRDFRKAKRVLSGIDAALCTETFTFGCKGRPRYIQGPNDDETRVKRIRAILDARVGPDGYDYLIAETGDEEYDDLPDDEDDNESPDAEDEEKKLQAIIGGYLELCDENTPNRFCLGGMFTAMQICPGELQLDDFDEAQPDPRKVPQDRDMFLKDLRNLLAIYWDHIGGILDDEVPQLESATAEDFQKCYPLDLRMDDFKDRGDYLVALIQWAAGFMEAAEIFAEDWNDALTRPDLANAWSVIRAWADPGGADGIIALSQAAGAEGKKLELEKHDLPGAVAMLAHALRPQA